MLQLDSSLRRALMLDTAGSSAAATYASSELARQSSAPGAEQSAVSRERAIRCTFSQLTFLAPRFQQVLRGGLQVLR
jgi:hypothetical protein